MSTLTGSEIQFADDVRQRIENAVADAESHQTRVVLSAKSMLRLSVRLEAIEGLGDVRVTLRESLPDRVRMVVRLLGLEFHVDDMKNQRLCIWEATDCPKGYRPPVTVNWDDNVMDGFRRAHARAVGYDAAAAADTAVLHRFGPDLHRGDSPDVDALWRSTYEQYQRPEALAWPVKPH